ncbi:MAG: hypothetical protein V7607_605 [Solirubrobacteraceae bacterium]
MTGPQRVLIVGGGIGGLCLAGARARAGSAVTLLEREPVWRGTSSGISLHPIAIRALDRLGLLEQIVQRGSVHDTIEHHNPAGVLIDTTTPPRLAGPDKPAGAGIMRTDLHEILVGYAEGAGAEIRLGLTITALEDRGDAVTVSFSHGGSESYDLVVGADGLRSSIREMILGQDAGVPAYTGTMSWRAVVPRHPDVTTLSIFYGPVVAGANPVSDDEMYVFLLPAMAEPRRIRDDEMVPMIHEYLAAFTGPMGDVREQITDPSQIVVRPIESCLVSPPWNRGRTVLMGDAVHAPPPTLATGGGMAMEDAVVLDEELRNEPTVESAIERYVERRWPRSRDSVERTLAHLKAISDGVSGPEIARLEGMAQAALAVPL